jgi:dimethylsulfone monooxygenase
LNLQHWKDDPRAETNPLFNDNKLKLGLFGLNGAGFMTSAKEATTGEWSLSARASKLSEAAGFDVLVPFSRWKGFVEEDPAHATGMAMDPYTWAAATSQVAPHSAVFSTSHVPTIHPVAAAKQCATIDQISGGRFGLNVVAGWNMPELEMFGGKTLGHAERYDQAAEWMDILNRLWTSDEAFDFEGRYYSVKRAVSLPKPVQRPRPPIMNAGGSERGRLFAAKYSDMAFVIAKSDDPDELRAEVELYRRTAREEFNRDVQVWTFAYVVLRDTDEEARDFLNYYTVEKGDEAALDGWMRLQGMHTQLMPPDVMEKLRYRFKAGSGGVELVGTAEKIASRLEVLSKSGFDGVLLGAVGVEDMVQRWTASVTPLLQQQGLRL